MFGHRNDGIDVSKTLDPIILFTPLIMPTRCESMNQVTYPAEYEPMANFIRSSKASGHTISFLTIMAAAYVRTVRRYPVMNYFVMGSRIYCHRDISISLAILRDTDDGSYKEALVKVHCTPEDTIADVARKFDEQVAIAKKPEEGNGTADFASRLMRIPVLPWVVVQVAKITDKLGFMPKKACGDQSLPLQLLHYQYDVHRPACHLSPSLQLRHLLHLFELRPARAPDRAFRRSGRAQARAPHGLQYRRAHLRWR